MLLKQNYKLSNKDISFAYDKFKEIFALWVVNYPNSGLISLWNML